MYIHIPFLSKPKVEITSIIINMSKKTHSLPGVKVGKKFTYKLRFSNAEANATRVLSIKVEEPFKLIRVSHNLPIDVKPREKIVFDLKCRIDVDYIYNGPMKINLEAMQVPESET